MTDDVFSDSRLKNTPLYQEFLAEREEILKHKWLESEKQGTDIGFEKALLDWIVKHRSTWRNHRRPPGPGENNAPASAALAASRS
jgi:hypothetical protein